jgi:hypothetical protein
MSMQDIKAAGPGGLESLEKMSKRQRGQAISIATEAAKLSGGAMTVQDILEAGGGRDARSALAKALGVSVGGLDDALKRLEPASGFFDLVGKEEQRKQTGAGADMLAEQQIILAQGRARIAADPYASAVKARADAEREITETLKRRAAAEGAFLSMMKDIWPFGETSALKELRKTNQRITEAAPVDKASFSAGR